jgi:DNA-binding NtrC family response regulator
MADLVIVDDDNDLAELLAEFLRMEGHEVRVAHDGDDGLKVILEGLADIVISDVEMPILTGPALARAMCVRDAGLENIPVILCSGVLNLPAVAAAIGTPYFLAKPCDLDTLKGVLSRALAERRAPHPGPPRSAS